MARKRSKETQVYEAINGIIDDAEMPILAVAMRIGMATYARSQRARRNIDTVSRAVHTAIDAKIAQVFDIGEPISKP